MSAEIDTTATTAQARIVGINIPFWDLVFLLVKLTVAAIPAIIILAILGSGVVIFFAALFAGSHVH